MQRDIQNDFILWFTILFGVFAIVTFGEVPPMEFEEAILEAEMKQDAERYGYTFEWDVTQIGQYSTGYNPKHSNPLIPRGRDDMKPLKSLSLEDFGKPLTPIMNQGNCGSCVIFSFSLNIMDMFALRGIPLPLISRQHYMNCSSGGQCNGAYGEEIASDAVRLGKSGGFYLEQDYPYIARSGRCQVKQGKQKVGIVTAWKTIDGSDYSILSSLHEGKPVSVGIAANGSLQSYRSGIYNACNSNRINHYVVIRGLDCGKAKDKDGNCQFDANGNLPKDSEAIALVANSWGKNWGEAGSIRMRLYGRSGQRCNGLAAYDGDAQVLDLGIPMPPPGPITFSVESNQMTLEVTLKVGAKFTKSELEAELKSALETLEGVNK